MRPTIGALAGRLRAVPWRDCALLLALVFSFLAWRASLRAEDSADNAYEAAQQASDAGENTNGQLDDLQDRLRPHRR